MSGEGPTTTLDAVMRAIRRGDPIPEGDAILSAEEAAEWDRIKALGPPQWVKDLPAEPNP